nr:hypothetical protein [Bartonella grahamii]
MHHDVDQLQISALPPDQKNSTAADIKTAKPALNPSGYLDLVERNAETPHGCLSGTPTAP